MKRSLRSKLIVTMLTTLALTGAVTLGIVAWIQYKTATKNMAAIQHHIHESIVSKGQVLIQNHSLALKGLALDNAYGDVTKLVTRSVKEDKDVVYGLFLDADSMPWVYVTEGKNDPKDKEKWKELKLEPEDISLKKLATREISLLKKEIYEVAMPVTDEDELLGTIRYGLSLERIRTELAKTRNESEAALKSTLYLLGGIVLLITFFGILLASRSASRITKPLSNLTEAANTIAGGDREVQVDISSGDEIEVLGDSFNQMVTDLNESYASLEDLNLNLEHKVEERTAELSSRNRDMRMIMENVEQGFITVFKDGIMSPERSAIVDEWFDHFEDGMSFLDFVGAVDKDFAECFSLSWEDLFEDIMPLEVTVDQMPRYMIVGGRHLQFSYSPIMDDQEDVMGLLVVLADITEQLEYEKKEAAQKELLAVFERVSKDKGGYLAYHKDAEQLVSRISTPTKDESIDVLKREIHTLKGNSALFSVMSVAEVCHRVENEIEETKKAPTSKARKEIKDRWNDYVERTRMLIQQDDDAMTVSRSDFDKIIQALKKNQSHQTILKRLSSWQLEPVDKQFERISEQATALAERMGKGTITIKKASNGLRIDQDTWSEFWSSLSHVIRNAVDHGIEDEATRKASGKEETGQLSLVSTLKKDVFEIQVGDNGAGIDWKQVAQKADTLGLPHSSENDLINVLLSDGFSTKSTVSETSGRGVGMAAVKQSVEKLSGRIEVDSKEGIGTAWKFIFPTNSAEVFQDQPLP